jgi:hypothetical protein
MFLVTMASATEVKRRDTVDGLKVGCLHAASAGMDTAVLNFSAPT